MLPTIGIALLVLAGGVGIAASRRPDEFRVSRSAVLPAASENVFAQVNDLRRWDDWSPWAKLDPNAKNTFGPRTEGEGAWMSWEGNRNVGAGKITILESHPTRSIRFRLEFYKPFRGTNTVEFTFEPRGTDTAVTWTMFGPNTFIGKLMGLVMNCEKMCGTQFEQGLAQLGAAAGSGGQGAREKTPGLVS